MFIRFATLDGKDKYRWDKMEMRGKERENKEEEKRSESSLCAELEIIKISYFYLREEWQYKSVWFPTSNQP